MTTPPTATGDAVDESLPVEADFFLGIPGQIRIPCKTYNESWRRHFAPMTMVTIETLVVNSSHGTWQKIPTLCRYREVPNRQKPLVATRIGKAVGLQVMKSVREEGNTRPAVFCIEKPWLEGFFEGYESVCSHPFVLLAVNGGDAPMTAEHQRKIASAKGFLACYANNMHVAIDPSRFIPMPIGVSREDEILRTRSHAKPWRERDARLLVPPMRLNNRHRVKYVEVLSAPEYAHVARVVKGPIPYEDFLDLLASHKAVLSPIGRGYDCGRTWQTVAIGSVPLVINDPQYDDRLYHGLGPVVIPNPEVLTPALLESLLCSLEDPEQYANVVTLEYWKQRWASHY
eukprot:PhF_6_TR40565/c0_g1_i1/m.60822